MGADCSRSAENWRTAIGAPAPPNGRGPGARRAFATARSQTSKNDKETLSNAPELR
jgi:hypothetical protein